MTKNNLLLIGGGGHCKSCIDVIESQGKYKIVGIVDMEKRIGQEVLGYKILASDKDVPQLVRKFKNALIAFSSDGNSQYRVNIFNSLKQSGYKFPSILSPLAYFSKNASIEEGSIVMHKAVVNASASIGRNCIINTMALVEHDSRVGDHCHISTGAVINGYCNLGQRVFIGSRSVIIDKISICDDVVVGAGSVVIKSITIPGIYVGTPARRVAKE
jgi:sugar O-acyltransferase (sialic acid O-acetyltransferase NeuD family)